MFLFPFQLHITYTLRQMVSEYQAVPFLAVDQGAMGFERHCPQPAPGKQNLEFHYNTIHLLGHNLFSILRDFL